MRSADGDTLYDLARRSIEHGLRFGSPVEPKVDEWPEAQREKGASFVTLRIAGQLRGCVGSLEATRALVSDIASSAFAAAFRDPRFPPVGAREIPLLEIHIAVLTRPVPIAFDSEEDLLAKLRPHIDGLVLEAGPHRATFLPAVWEQLPDPRDFLQALKRKAGLTQEAWPPSISAKRYTADSIPD
jgi:hypothetical protein